MTDAQRAIIEWAARHAVDVPQEEVAVSLGVRLSEVRAIASRVTPESKSKSKIKLWRRAAGALANLAYEHSPLTHEEIAEIAGVSRQHLVTCRKEAQRG